MRRQEQISAKANRLLVEAATAHQGMNICASELGDDRFRPLARGLTRGKGSQLLRKHSPLLPTRERVELHDGIEIGSCGLCGEAAAGGHGGYCY